MLSCLIQSPNPSYLPVFNKTSVNSTYFFQTYTASVSYFYFQPDFSCYFPLSLVFISCFISWLADRPCYQYFVPVCFDHKQQWLLSDSLLITHSQKTDSDHSVNCLWIGLSPLSAILFLSPVSFQYKLLDPITVDLLKKYIYILKVFLFTFSYEVKIRSFLYNATCK